MGASSTKNKTSKPRFVLDDEEIQCLERNFNPLMSKHEVVDEKELEKFLEKVLPKHVTHQLCYRLAQFSKETWPHNQPFNPHHYKYSSPITFSGIVAAVAELTKADVTDHCILLTKLVSSQSENVTCTAQEMFKFLTDMIISYFTSINNSAQYRSWKDGVDEIHPEKLAKNLLHGLFYKGKDLKNCAGVDSIPELEFTANEIENWYSQTQIVSHLIDKVFKMAFKLENSMDKIEGQYKELLPICYNADWMKTKSLLSLPDIILINQHLPSEQRGEWRYLFSSRQFGDSFSQMMGRIINKGPTVLIIRDKTGCIAGGYASESWKTQPQFKGSNSCFMFTLHPKMGIFSSTGLNDHYMYLNINQQTMPNGLGMGGQLNYFGLWLDHDFGKGKCSKTCTTFSCPQLLSELEFTFDMIEVWGVGPELKLEAEGSRSALDNIDPELKVIMELAGRTAVSDDIRKADKKAALHEEKSSE